MKKKTMLVLVLMLYGGIHAQEVISTQGDSYQGTGVSVDYTIGEPIIFTGTGTGTTLTQGFHQSKWDFAGIEIHDAEFDAEIYPNPVEDILTVESKNFSEKNYAVYDAAGRIVDEGDLKNEKTIISAESWAPGSYSVILRDNEKQKLKTVKLIKNQ